MIELNVVYDHQLGQVVNKLGTLVEERRVVFIALDHEIFGIVQARALPKIFRDSTDQITRFVPGFLQNPGKQRRRRGLPVCASDDKIVPAAQKMIFQDFRQRHIKEFPVEHGFHFRIAAFHRVPDHHHIDIRRDVLGAISSFEFDATLFEEDRHRRINIFIRAGNFESALLQRGRDCSHGRAGNSKKMKTSRRFFHNSSLRVTGDCASETTTHCHPERSEGPPAE